MESLSRSRGTIKGKFTAFKNYIARTLAAYPDSSVSLDEVKRLETRERIAHMREAHDKYDQIQTAIDELTSDEQETLEYCERVEEEYFHTSD